MNSFTGQDFSQIENAFCRLVDETTDEELARYELSGSGRHNAQIMAKVSRDGGGWTHDRDRRHRQRPHVPGPAAGHGRPPVDLDCSEGHVACPLGPNVALLPTGTWLQVELRRAGCPRRCTPRARRCFSSASKLPSAPPMMMPTWMTARAASGFDFSLPMCRDGLDLAELVVRLQLAGVEVELLLQLAGREHRQRVVAADEAGGLAPLLGGDACRRPRRSARTSPCWRWRSPCS